MGRLTTQRQGLAISAQSLDTKEITPEDLPADQSASNEPETEQDSDQSASKVSEPGHDSSVRIDSEASFLKRFANWLSPSNHIEL